MSDSKAWIRNVVAALEAETDEVTCRRVLESCGRRCFPPSLGKKAHALWAASATTRAFIERLHEVFEPATVSQDEIHMVYPECYCRQIRGVPAHDIPDAYCCCSVGWIRELFLLATERDARADALTTIVRGGVECRFRVDLGIPLDEPLR